MELVTYLAFDGDCEAAFQHYERVLGGKILMMMRGSDAPADSPVPPAAANRIMHARLQAGDRLLMGGDSPIGCHAKPQGFCTNITLSDAVAAERIFRDLGEGGTTTMPISETFWARRFGMLTDRFGVPWMVNCEEPMGEPVPEVAPFSISRTYDVPKERLWQVFTENEHMQRWWGSKGVTLFSSKMDLRPGGTYHYGLRSPDGKELWGRFTYREIEAPGRVVLVSSFSDERGLLQRSPFPGVWPLEMASTFTFTDAGSGKSTFTVSWQPYRATAEQVAAFEAGRAGMTGGWTGTLDRLEDYFRRPHDTGAPTTTAGKQEMQKITPCLWFEGNAEEAVRFYTSLLPGSKIVDIHRAHVDVPGNKEGGVLLIKFTLAGQSYLALNAARQDKFNDAISLSVDCADQAEVDRLWSALTADGGRPIQCGWLKDKYGLSWQIVPRRLPELLSNPDPEKGRRVMQAMLQMVKIEIAGLEAAAAQV